MVPACAVAKSKESNVGGSRSQLLLAGAMHHAGGHAGSQ